MTGFGRGMLEWLRRRKPAHDDGPLIIHKGDRREPQPPVDPIEELARIVGDSGDRRPRAKPTSTRRVRSRPRG